MDELIKALRNNADHYGFTGENGLVHLLTNAADAIEELLQKVQEFGSPAADVRPVVQGKWVPVGADDLDEGMFMCSECGSEHFFPELLLNIPADNFCPNCGADMREG